MVAIRVVHLKPRMVVLHGPKSVDQVGKALAEKERDNLGSFRKERGRNHQRTVFARDDKVDNLRSGFRLDNTIHE